MGAFYNNYIRTDRNKAENEAFSALVSDMMQKTEYTTKTITAIQMEQQSKTVFNPSMFYIFLYNKPVKSGDTDFFDRMPLVFCTGISADSMTGINFNYIPNNVRARFIDILFEGFTTFFDDTEKKRTDLRLNETLIKEIISGRGIEMMVGYMKEHAKFDISKCVRVYKRKNVLKPRMIEYDNWQYIPFLTFKDPVRGVNIANVQRQLINIQNRR